MTFATHAATDAAEAARRGAEREDCAVASGAIMERPLAEGRNAAWGWLGGIKPGETTSFRSLEHISDTVTTPLVEAQT